MIDWPGLNVAHCQDFQSLSENPFAPVDFRPAILMKISIDRQPCKGRKNRSEGPWIIGISFAATTNLPLVVLTIRILAP